MQQIISEKQKGIFRALAVLVAAPALWLAYHAAGIFQAGFTPITGGSIFVLIFEALMAAACFFLLRLTCRLWTQYDSKQLHRVSLLPAFLVFFLVARAVSGGLTRWLTICRPVAEGHAAGTEIAQFIALVAAGITYRIVKRRLYQTIDRTEIINPITFSGHRKMYFIWLSVLFGFMLFSLHELYALIGTDRGDRVGLPFLLLSPPLAILFYKLCVYVFVTRPLKTLQPEPSTFQLRRHA